MLRLVVAIFFTVFYIGSLAVFMAAINCNWFMSDHELPPVRLLACLMCHCLPICLSDPWKV